MLVEVMLDPVATGMAVVVLVDILLLVDVAGAATVAVLPQQVAEAVVGVAIRLLKQVLAAVLDYLDWVPMD
jgi:hypothetical protein